MPSSQSCLPHLKIPTERPRAAQSLQPRPRSEGVSTREKNIREETPASIFHCQLGQSWSRAPGTPPHCCALAKSLTLSALFSCALGKGATVLVPDRYLDLFKAGPRVRGTAMSSLLRERESELSVFCMLFGSIDRQLLHLEAEPQETKLTRVIQRVASKSRTRTWVS